MAGDPADLADRGGGDVAVEQLAAAGPVGSVLRAPSDEGPVESQLGSERPFWPGVSTARPGGWPETADVGLPRAAASGFSGAGWAQPCEAAINSSETAADIQTRPVMHIPEGEKSGGL
jgi:hypothetical protein